nr:formate dehydrogenase accessory sulfurtransferase FdhD [Actinomyces sp.]
MSRLAVRRRILAIDADHPSGWGRVDTLSVEEPLEIRVGGQPYTVTMRTPGHDVELAQGLLAAEGVITALEDVRTARYCAGSVRDDASGQAVNTYNVLDLQLAAGVEVPRERLRQVVTSSACGVCGSQSIDLLRTRVPWDLGADDVRVGASAVLAMPGALREAQKVFASTGGLHGVGLFDSSGRLLVAREDVGRHNATDKVVGWAMQQGLRPARGTVLFVSGRTSFELAQKAAMAGVPVLAGISAPSSLAVEVAEEVGITLIGFVRGARMNVYTRPERVTLPG